MTQILIRDGFVITMNDRREVYDGGDVLVMNDRIHAVGHIRPEDIGPDAEIVDAADRMVLPGLVNTHVHLSQQLARGLSDDVDLLTWLRGRIWPFESSLDEQDNYVSSLACCAELIHSGVTTFAEAGGQHVDAMGRAVQEIGVRAVLAQCTMDQGAGLPAGWVHGTDQCLDRQCELFDRWHGVADDRIRMWFGLRTLFNCSDELATRTKALADARGVGINMHLAEIVDEVRYMEKTRGAPSVHHLAALGVLDTNLLAAHCVWLDPREIDLFLLHDVKVSHCPAAAMRMLGFAAIPEMLAKGICVSLGTDGAPSNNHMDLIDEMYLATLIHKGRRLDPTIVPAHQVLEMATVNGARSLLWDADIGSLEPGKKADLVILDPHQVGSIPLHDPVSAVANSMHASNVTDSMCDGRWLMRGRRLVTIDEEDVLREAQQRSVAVRARAGIELPARYPVIRRPEPD